MTTPEEFARRSAAGKLNAAKRHTKSSKERFEEKVVRSDSGCWEWVRELHEEGVTHAALSRMYSVATTTISNVVLRKRWAHV